ncbi:putative Rab-GTPase-TBC domain-containing protein [Helianthus annuus]|uniref:Putative ypt/Rab-GAP domain of gyp1p superfamily protein n=1 Tax=Helianthus annuus TaxID=4232 RepID=A0A251SWT2_HELAN|nr:TBC1 domain family member 13 isoform X1 [Helianthus annuus]KAF5768270.1 putative Rab-GTPase-TBC domain-containing protein [Helianthus annuus]KAJ0463573.1 putative Rab-GTPase-TBC domain-containing protein [Helianthus annuus]KAJ0467720.1 putative Rab-GTPase-TBC domain-containing protein [Helianthus annuus]KAJ0485046.1 putative Rab-GTPase-TBC domain-containing protein [Helianthus annuus]KAJ0655598.1 putative Rab-GTPase-TBC domain-containing protein [Helianthus annuus]
MVKKKRVPDWLNSPMWASPTVTTSPPSKSRSLSPPPNHHDRTGKTSSVTSSDSSVNESRFMLPPAASIRPESIQRTEVRDSSTRRGSSDYDNDSSGSVVEDVSRQAQLLQELSKKIINLGELRQLASLGIPDAAGIRSTTWKLLLGYLPIDKRMWSSELSKKRSQYKHFKEDLLMNPSEITRKLEDSTSPKNGDQIIVGKGLLARSKIPHGEHPLSLGKTSIWNQYFQDSEIIEQIDRDVKRTHPDIPFFSGDSAFAKANQDSLKNILIIFAKLNPGIRYVQGMNEILAPLFYVFKTDPNEDYAVNAEADTFFCFVELLSDFRDNFCQQLDNSIVGIRSTISRLSQLLKQHDEELWRHLEVTTKVNPQFYAFRWITLLLTQEFNFTDILHIWDMLLSNPVGPRETLLRICCAMLILVRRRLLAGDFTANLKLLQSYPSTNVSHLLYVANKLNSQSAH